jgi:acetyl esterase/lipase
MLTSRIQSIIANQSQFCGDSRVSRLCDAFRVEPVIVYLSSLVFESVFLTQDIEIEGSGGLLLLRVYKPADEDGLPVVVYLHGGGFVLGDLATHDNVCSILAKYVTYASYGDLLANT